MTDDRLHQSQTETQPGSYEVGYGRTPTAHRFTKGQSGNPSGKPKGARDKQPRLNEERLKAIILEEAYRTIVIHEDGRPLTVTMIQAAVRSLAVAAVKGKLHAQALLIKLVGTVEQQNSGRHNQYVDALLDYKINWMNELARRKAVGSLLPDPVPHPDDIHVDMIDGTVRILGPQTQQKKALLDEWMAQDGNEKERA